MNINSMPRAICEYETTRLANAQNKRIHGTHQSSAIYTPTHRKSTMYTDLLPPISTEDALSSAPASSFSCVTADPCLPLLASGRCEKRAGHKRACSDLLQDAFECKRRPRLMPGLAAVSGMKGCPDACHQNVRSFFSEELKLNLSPVGLRTASMSGHTDTIGLNECKTERTALILHEHFRKFPHTQMQQDRMPSHGEHSHPILNLRDDGANQEPFDAQAVVNSRGNVGTSNMWPHVHHNSSDINGQISDYSSALPKTLVEKKTSTSQEEDHVCTPRQAPQGKQSSLHQAQQGKQSSASLAKLNSKVLVDVTNKFQVTAIPDAKKNMEEDDPHRLSQRHKQIEFGKNTLGYEHYIELVPKSKRKGKDPRTPNPKQVCSKRSWDGQIRQWRRLLHNYDPPAEDGEELAEDMTLLTLNKKNEKLDPGKDANDSKIFNKENLSRLQESKVAGTIGGVANDDELAIYEDWID